ncbi:hypothetical protein B5F76_07795 [Desulfovibrio sp. An276]|uniref:hypothetical protein n=1 Tax=Desulfovibrio sp. An276 TaxID=1965618 RepID=UPI000B38B618|nr:hypothetical protein [Desulfovibrio sp. An276]OUO52320.1 hypothetical protein B5F76_07795 [Desulfovibrio sp. An276]
MLTITTRPGSGNAQYRLAMQVGESEFCGEAYRFPAACAELAIKLGRKFISPVSRGLETLVRIAMSKSHCDAEEVCYEMAGFCDPMHSSLNFELRDEGDNVAREYWLSPSNTERFVEDLKSTTNLLDVSLTLADKETSLTLHWYPNEGFYLCSVSHGEFRGIMAQGRTPSEVILQLDERLPALVAWALADKFVTEVVDL